MEAEPRALAGRPGPHTPRQRTSLGIACAQRLPGPSDAAIQFWILHTESHNDRHSAALATRSTLEGDPPCGKRCPATTERYVAQPDGKTVVVYDTASNTVIGSFVTDQNSGASIRSIAVAADGTLYITDAGDNKVYVVTVGDPTML
jgi:outer membrane protein assembly factor BamB